jgi:hypothetical protein
MDDASKRRAGRPKAVPQSGPLVLEGGPQRVKVELEIGRATADELKEYARWVELAAPVDAKSALFKTVDFALREVFRRDRLWQERRRKGEPKSEYRESPTAPQALPPLAATPPSSPRPVPAARPTSPPPASAPAGHR